MKCSMTRLKHHHLMMRGVPVHHNTNKLKGQWQIRTLFYYYYYYLKNTWYIELGKGCLYKPERPQNRDTKQAIEQQKETDRKKEKLS